MKVTKYVGMTLLGLSFAHGAAADNHQASPFEGVLGLTDVVVSNVSGYVSTLQRSGDIFAGMGAASAGFCSAFSGADRPGEAIVYAFFPSFEAGFNGVEYQQTDPAFRAFSNSLSAYRELTGSRIQRVIRPYDGEGMPTFALRSVYVATENPDTYMAALAALETAYHENGFNDVSIDIYQDIGSGDTSNLLEIKVVAPSLGRLGETHDVLFSQPWAQQAFANVADARSQIVMDKMYSCQVVYFNQM